MVRHVEGASALPGWMVPRLDVNTTRRTPARSAAAQTLRVPSTFTRKASRLGRGTRAVQAALASLKQLPPFAQ